MGAELLPNFMVLKSEDYVFFMHANANVRGFVSCTGKSAFDPYAKIAVERSTIDSRYVHLRFCASNQYWAKSDATEGWIVAGSNQPEEDRTKSTCTLFQPYFNQLNKTVQFMYIQNARAVRVGANSRLTAVMSSSFTNFTCVDWQTLVQLPKHVAFKGYDDKYVDVVRASRREYLRCLSEDGNKAVTSYEVQMHPEGFLRFKSVPYNFWVRTGNWIAADSADKDGKDRETLFWPVRVDAKTLALRSNNLFIVVQKTKNAYLSAEASSITNEARFTVEELVLERSIFNTRYRMEDSRIYDETPFLAGVGSARNDSDKEATKTVTVNFEETTSFTFTNSVSVMLGVSTEFKAGFPFLAEGKIEISAEVTNTLEWNRTKEETKSVQASYTLPVPPMSEVQVSYIGTRGTCDVPFSYTQRDVSSTDGRPIVSQHVDGVFNGVSCYNYHFNQPRISSLVQQNQ